MAIDVSVFRYYVDKGTTIGSSGGAISSGGGGVATPFDDSGLYVYVDGSLALRDASIIRIDASLNDQINLEGIFLKETSANISFGLRDTSIAWLNTNKAPIASPIFTGTVTVNGARPITLQSGVIRIKGDAGGWANAYGFLGSADTDYEGFGAYGAVDGLSNYYIGTYSSQKVKVFSGGNVTIPFGLHIGGDSDAGDSNLFIDGVSQNPSFTAGWLGTNWQIAAGGDAVFENLQVRGSAKFRELIIDQLSVVGGSDLLSIARGKITSVDVANSKVTLEDPNTRGTSTFAQYDFFWIKSIDIDNTLVNDCKGQISAIVGTTLTLDFSVTGHTGAITDIAVGDVIVQRGHPTIAARQNLIYRTVSDTGNPFERTLTGINTLAAFTNLDNISVQIGNLSSLGNYGIMPPTPGVGLYTLNGYFTGKIVSTAGTIGGWSIGTTTLTDASGMVGISSNRTAADDVRFWAGGTDRTTAPFRVTEGGSLTATGMAELGTSATTGTYFGNLSIKGGQLWENTYNGESGLYVNVNGYHGGTTQFRALNIYDGKQGRIAYFNHYGLLVDLDFRVSGATILDGAATINNTLNVTGQSTLNTLTAESITSNGYIYADIGIDSNGYIWAGTNITATTTIYAGGNISGLSFTDRTPFYEGDAIKEIMAIKGKDGKIDHSTLPIFVQKDITTIDKSTKATTISKERDLGAMISMLTIAVQQLTNRIEKLESSKI